AVAIVGSRACDAYGRAAAELFAGRLAAAGLVVVSGLARGIDTFSHRAALAAPDGRTVAVLGCGLGVDYPRGSESLRRRILEQGAIVTEFPPGCSPQPRNFPIRNRIIAALGHACLVVQAAKRSGSLITAHLALELGRDVFAVPGRIFDDRSAGTNALIRDGAHPVQSPDDLLETLPVAVKERLPAGTPATVGELPGGIAAAILDATAVGSPRTVDDICERSGVSASQAVSALVELELDGHVVRHPGSAYSRRAT
ncbi:MAG: DNA-processing protein DprA, partial [Thermoanaerobaculia bacterium]|nr:DNA-processing protein DprA [Thermoanaerobaculia bacterium]